MQPRWVRQPPTRLTAKAVAASWPVFAGIVLLMLGNGLQGTLLGTRATLEGFGALVTGTVMACYYAGFIASSFLTPSVVRRVGHVRCYAAFAAGASVAVLVHGLVVEPVVWAMMRGVTGFCLAGIYIVSESWLNGSSENASRGSVMSAYNMVLLLSVATGQMTMALGDPSSIGLFIVASALISLAVLPMLLSLSPGPSPDRPERFGLREIWHASPLGTILALGAGLIFGAYGGMGAAFATGIGLSATWVAIFMTSMTVAGGLAQWPLGALSDLVPRRTVVLLSTTVATVAAVVAAGLTESAPLLMVAAAAGFGAAALPLYSLANAVANDRVSADERVAAGSALILLYGCGSIAGPLVASGAIEIVGEEGFFLSLAAICAALGAAALIQMLRRPEPGPEAHGDRAAESPAE